MMENCLAILGNKLQDSGIDLQGRQIITIGLVPARHIVKQYIETQL